MYDETLMDAEERMEKAVEHLGQSFRGIRTGRASPALVEDIRADFYGSPTPLKHMASVSVPEPRMILVKPFDASTVNDVLKAIQKSSLGITPQSDGKLIRLTVPPLSEEQRKKLSAVVRDKAEEARVSLATFGRRILVWSNTDTHCVLEMVDPWDHTKAWPAIKFAPDAQLTLVDREEAVAVYEPDGRFVLVDLTDGESVIDAQLEPEPLLSGIFVFPSRENYVLVTQAAEESPVHRDPNRRVQPVHGSQSVRIGRGQVYAFDRDGNSLWESSRTVRDRYLPLNQPARLPVLTFASVVRQRKDGKKFETAVSVLSLDRRNGRAVLDTSLKGPTNSFRLVGDPEKKTVRLQLQSATVTMTFTAEPLPPVPEDGEAAATPEERSPSSPVRAVWDAIRKAAIGPPLVPEEPAPEEEDTVPAAEPADRPPGDEDGDGVTP